MNEIMKNIVWNESVQSLLEPINDLIEDQIITQQKYQEICNEVQNRINSDPTRFILEPIEVAYLIEESILIYSSRIKNTNFPVCTIEQSVELAIEKQIGRDESLDETNYKRPIYMGK